MHDAKVRLTIPRGIDPARVTGAGDCILRRIDAMDCGRAVVRGDAIQLSGAPDQVEVLAQLFTQLFSMASSGQVPTAEDAERIVDALRRRDLDGARYADDVILTHRGRAVRPKTAGQKAYIDAIRSNTVTFCLGPAGTGKTYLAMAVALAALKRHEVSRIILTRPVVEAGESLGFLPGTLQDKIDPYIRPLIDALFDLTDAERANEYIERGIIEIAPLAYMRGRTLNDAFVLLDEAQNTTPEQMKMFLTRLGFNSTFIITGDATQRDLAIKRGGLVDIEQILAGVPDIGFIHLGRADVVRHQLVGKIVEAYDAFETARDARAHAQKGERRERAHQ